MRIISILFILILVGCESKPVNSKSDDQKFCKVQSDCRLVAKACGEKDSINAEHVKAFERRMENLKKVLDCQNSFWAAGESQPDQVVCINNQCSLE